MQHERAKQRVVTFKAEEELAAFLDDMPNKSDFIRRALLSALLEPCPVCHGRGSVPRSLRSDLEKIFNKQQFVPCSFCGYDFPLGTEKTRKGINDKLRLRQFMGGGEFYCNDCFDKTLACEDCGEHVVESRLLLHRRRHKGSGVKAAAARHGR